MAINVESLTRVSRHWDSSRSWPKCGCK